MGYILCVGSNYQMLLFVLINAVTFKDHSRSVVRSSTFHRISKVIDLKIALFVKYHKSDSVNFYNINIKFFQALGELCDISMHT